MIYTILTTKFEKSESEKLIYLDFRKVKIKQF